MLAFTKKPNCAPASAKRFFVVNQGKVFVIFGTPKLGTVTSFDGTSRTYQIGTDAFTSIACANSKAAKIRKPFFTQSATQRRLLSRYAQA